MRCYQCGVEFEPSPAALRRWAESGRPFDPTDWECEACRRAEAEIPEPGLRYCIACGCWIAQEAVAQTMRLTRGSLVAETADGAHLVVIAPDGAITHVVCLGGE